MVYLHHEDGKKASGVDRHWSDFRPRDYLQEYYTDVGAENVALLRFAVKTFRAIPRHNLLLDFGGGPTIYPLIAATHRAKEIHFCDYLEANLAEVRLWLYDSPEAFDWHEFFKATLALEDQLPVTTQTVAHREKVLRQRLTRIFECDAGRMPPIATPQRYDVLVTNFCAESATGDRGEWRTFFRNIMSLLEPGGTVLLSTLKGATSYAVGNKTFPAVRLSEDDLTRTLIEEGFDTHSIVVETVPADRPSRHYEGLIMATARKRGDR